MDTKLQDRLLAATHGTKLGAILRCAMGRNLLEDSDTLPAFTSKAVCSSDGYLTANFADRNGVIHHGAFVGSYGELEQNICGLNAQLGLDAPDRAQVWDLIESWIATDYR